jgi:TonB family protein
MREAVDDILSERAALTSGMGRMVVLSLAVHALLVASFVYAPEFWGTQTLDNQSVMTISLGGVPGPEAGGMTPLANRPVQRVAEPDEKPARPTPPAEKPPEMVAPAPVTKPAPKTPPKPVEKPSETSSSKKPTSGAEIKTGAARVETGGAQVPFGGLSTGGGGGDGASVNVQNFCCPAYLQLMTQRIRQHWVRNQPVAGKVQMRFVVRRDGSITNVEVEESGGTLLDLASRRALANTRQLPPLPPEFPDSSLTVYLVFEYFRQ